MAKRDYLVEAAKQIRMALDREVSEDYEAAFNYYKNGVDLLLNGVQVDPNKEQREAVKRKTTQYLKRAEEIFISHLQDSLGKGSSQFGGYSSLRFRPIRNLSSPVEDLVMCKVVGIIDKVLTVQSLISKETFVVKSLAKSSWESHERPTIIPQGVPFMVKLLRYYVSEDAVYLHLEHVPGGRLFSKLHRIRTEALKEHPERFGPNQRKIRLKNSYTSPAISQEYRRNDGGNAETARPSEWGNPESPDTDSLASWDEAQHQLDSCSTHSYCEETGCLNSRLGKSNFQSEEHSLTHSRTGDVLFYSNPADGQCPHSQTQENPALPRHVSVGEDVVESLDATSNLSIHDIQSERIKSSKDFDVAWNAADATRDCGRLTVTGSGSEIPGSNSIPQINPPSLCDTGSQPNLSHTTNLHGQRAHTVPNALQLSIHNQSQGHDKPTQTSNGSRQRCGSSRTIDNSIGQGLALHRKPEEMVYDQTFEDRVISGAMDKAESSHISGNSQSHAAPHRHHTETQPLNPAGISLHFTEVKPPLVSGTRDLGQEVGWEAKEEYWDLSPLCRDIHQNREPEQDPHSQPPAPSKEASPGGVTEPDRPDMEQVIEVDGWCHLPRLKARVSSGRPRQGRWGLPEGEVREWGAQILLALESLHQQGVLCRDLNPKNVLVSGSGKVCLTYFGQWNEVQSEVSPKAMEQMYCAPEIGGVSKITEACDWWSLGALLFELLTGMPLWQCHPTGVHPHTQLLIPDHLSNAAASLLTELLQFDAGYRLGSGGGGMSDIKCHPFFSSIPWSTLSS